MDNIFQILECVVMDITTMQKELLHLDSPGLEQAGLDRIGGAIGQEVGKNLRPLFVLCKTLSSTLNAPGDLLKEQLQALEAKLSPQAQAGATFGQPWLGSGSASFPMMATVCTGNLQPLQSPGVNNDGVEECIHVLEDQIKDLQDEVAFSSIKIGVTTFMSRTQTKAWMDRTNCLKCSCLFFLDTMALLALMHSRSESDKAIAKFASITKKVGYASLDEALVVMSFSLELPEAFGSLPNSGVAQDSRSTASPSHLQGVGWRRRLQ
jgi:hypothetical protein